MYCSKRIRGKKGGEDSDFKFKGDDEEVREVKNTDRDTVGGWGSKHKKGGNK